MAAIILAVGTTAADSSDVVVAAGSELTVALDDASGSLVDPEAAVLIMLKNPAGQYFRVDKLDYGRPALVLSAGTWRFSRPAGPSVGVFSG